MTNSMNYNSSFCAKVYRLLEGFKFLNTDSGGDERSEEVVVFFGSLGRCSLSSLVTSLFTSAGDFIEVSGKASTAGLSLAETGWSEPACFSESGAACSKTGFG